MAGIRTCDRESQVQRPNHYNTEPPSQSSQWFFSVFSADIQIQTRKNSTPSTIGGDMAPVPFWLRPWPIPPLIFTRGQKGERVIYLLRLTSNNNLTSVNSQPVSLYFSHSIHRGEIPTVSPLTEDGYENFASCNQCGRISQFLHLFVGKQVPRMEYITHTGHYITFGQN